MIWPILTDKKNLDVELEAANRFLTHKKLPTIKSLEFVDGECDSHIVVNGGEYYITHGAEIIMTKTLRGERPIEVFHLIASYIDEPLDPEEPGGERQIVDISEMVYGSLAGFLIAVELEKIRLEWLAFRH